MASIEPSAAPMRVAADHITLEAGRVQRLVSSFRGLGLELVELGEPAAFALARNASSAYIARSRGYEAVLYCELGFVGDRYAWSQLAWNGLCAKGSFPWVPRDRRRLELHADYELRPWRSNWGAGPALILGQVDTDMAVAPYLEREGLTYQQWRDRTKRDLSAVGLEVVYRPHPAYEALEAPAQRVRDRLKRYTLEPARRRASLDEELGRASFAVTISSTAAVRAIVLGVPCHIAFEGSVAWPMRAQLWSGGEPELRREWLELLAALQWSNDELEDGTAMRAALQARETGSYIDLCASSFSDCFEPAGQR